jgi:hypothetical protein
MARERARANNIAFLTAPRCGAARKRDGLPCRQRALANGRCRFHGGKTPRGDQWHTRQWPRGSGAIAVGKADRKIRDRQRIDAKRASRIAAMTAAEREAYEAWRRAHAPGSATARERRRSQREQNARTRAMLAEPVKRDELRDLQRRAERLRDEAAMLRGEGIFG